MRGVFFAWCFFCVVLGGGAERHRWLGCGRRFADLLPLPITHLGHVLAVLVDVVLVLDELGLELFFEGVASFAGLG
jgi:hypothetical protein